MSIFVNSNEYIASADGKFYGAHPLGDKFSLTNYAIGVPHPDQSFGYDPLTIAAPSDPSEWPSAEAAGYYYIDNTHVSATDSGNTYGYPDLPRLTIPEGSFPAGTVIQVKGGGSDYTIAGDGRWLMTMAGTESDPCFIKGIGVTKPVLAREMRIVGSHTIVEQFTAGVLDSTQFRVGTEAQSNNICIRNNTLIGNQTSASGAVISAEGPSSASKHAFIVVYNNTIQDYGDNTVTAVENDIHGYKHVKNVTDMWFIGNTSSNLGGDCIQIGEATLPDTSEWSQRVYIAKNNMSNTYENAVDIKKSYDTIVSENVAYDFARANTGTNTTTAMVAHDDCEWVTFIANKIYNTSFGIFNTSGLNVHSVGNEIYNLVVIGTYNPSTAFETGTSAACHYRGTSSGYIVNNTIYNYVQGMQLHSANDYKVYNNIFSNKDRVDGYEINTKNSSDYLSYESDNNLFYNPTYPNKFRRASTIETLAEWQASTSLDSGAIITDPLMTAPGSADFTLGASSPALNAGITSQIYADFLARYGESIAIDIAGVTRPQGAAYDIGANERTA